MAINTVKATIQMRRGLERDFDADQMTAGEWAVSTDNHYVRMCFAPGVVVRMATYEAFERDMEVVREILRQCQDIQVAVDAMAKLAEQHSVAAAGSAQAAGASAQDAAGSAADAQAAEDAAKGYRDESQASRDAAAASASAASDSAQAAAGSAETAKGHQEAAKVSEENASASATAAGESEVAAAGSAQDSAASAEASATSADEASASADAAKDWSDRSKSYAVGTDGEYRPGDDADNSKYYYEQSKRLVQGYEGIMPMGTITFADLDNPDNQVPKYMFNISDGFTSDERFNDGGGKEYGPGMNVFYTMDEKWDVMTSASVLGIKGKKEEVYRQGNVTLTSEEIGALPETIDIPVGADLNDYIAPGLYSKVYAVYPNCPVLSSGSLIVTKAGNNIRQLFFSANSSNGIFERYYDVNHGWFEWNQLVQGVKGEAEESYRGGLVEITKENLGIGIASTEEPGMIKVDGVIVTVDENGVLHVDIPEATVDYNELENRPKINDILLEGDKTSKDFGIPTVIEMSAEEWSALPEEERNRDDIVYFLPDGEGSSNGGTVTIPDEITLKISELEQKIETLQTSISTMNSEMMEVVEAKADKTGIVLVGDVSGISVVDEETGKATISAKRKSCIAYAGGSNGGWYNIAYLKVPIYYQDYSITFLVEKTYGNDNFFAILRMMSRVTPSEAVLSASLTLECTNITDPTIFVLTHNIDSDNQIEYKIWVRNTTMYQGVAFTVLSEATGSQLTTGLFTLYSPYASEALSEIPSEYTQVQATLATIQNPVEKALSANAVDGIYRYDSNSNDGVTVLPRYGKRAFCVLSYFGNNGANGFSPITFILETPYNFSENNPKVSYIFRDSENTTIEITKNENDRYIIRALKDGNYTRYFSLLLITIN